MGEGRGEGGAFPRIVVYFPVPAVVYKAAVALMHVCTHLSLDDAWCVCIGPPPHCPWGGCRKACLLECAGENNDDPFECMQSTVSLFDHLCKCV